MSNLKEAIETSRVTQLELAAEKEAERRARFEADEARRRLQQENVEQAFSECQQILEEAHVSELFDEVNKEIFNGTGAVSSRRNTTNVSEILQDSRPNLKEVHYHFGISMKGKVGKTPTLLTAEATVIKPAHSFYKVDDPILRISSYTQEPTSKLRQVLRREVQWSGGSHAALGVRVVEGQEEPIKEWQDVNQVRLAVANVLVEQRVV